jgi:transposase InsO family protein
MVCSAGRAFVGGQIVQDDDVALVQRRDELAAHVGLEDRRSVGASITRLQRPVLPFADRLQNRVGHRRDQIGRNLGPMDLEQMALNLSGGHAGAYIDTIFSSKPGNGLWCADFKGEFKLGDRRYGYPLTVTDYASRYLLLCEALESTREDLAITAFEQLFQERGLSEAIRSDNGVPFASPNALFNLSKLSV